MWWVQGAACAYAFDDSINRNGMNPRFSASESSSALLFHSTRTTAVLHAGARLIDTGRALGGADHSHISRVASLREDLRRNISTGLQIKASASDEGWELSQHRCTMRFGGGWRTGIETVTVTTPVTDSVAQ